jgi:hypothetical protein
MGALGAFILSSGGKKWEVFELAATGVAAGVLSRRLIVGTSLVLGLAGKVENGPSVTDRLLGGLPRSFPEAVAPFIGHADETAGPCRRLDRDLLGVIAERDPSFHMFLPVADGVTAD